MFRLTERFDGWTVTKNGETVADFRTHRDASEFRRLCEISAEISAI